MEVFTRSKVFLIIFLLLSVPADLIAKTDQSRLDGVYVEAVETYLHEKSHRITLGLNIYPFNSYYNGFGLGLGYTYLFTKNVGWEIIGFDYVHSVKTGLTSELAEKYGVNPERIEKLEFIFSSNLAYVLAYGKMLFLDSYIGYFRLSALGGLGLINTTVESDLGLSVGIRFEYYIGDFLSYIFEIRNRTKFSFSDHYTSFSIGFGGNF